MRGLCASSSPDCTGLEPCIECQKVVLTEVVWRALQQEQAELPDPNGQLRVVKASRLGPEQQWVFVGSYSRIWRQLVESRRAALPTSDLRPPTAEVTPPAPQSSETPAETNVVTPAEISEQKQQEQSSAPDAKPVAGKKPRRSRRRRSQSEGSDPAESASEVSAAKPRSAAGGRRSEVSAPKARTENGLGESSPIEKEGK